MKPTDSFGGANPLCCETRHVLMVEYFDRENYKELVAGAAPALRLTQTQSRYVALELLQKHQFDLVGMNIMDSRPWVFGRMHWLLRWLRVNQPHLPVMVVTDYPSDSSEGQQIRAAGAAYWVCKGEPDFVERVRAILNRTPQFNVSRTAGPDPLPASLDAALASCLRSPDHKVRESAVQEVATAKLHAYREMVAHIMLTDKSWEIRSLAAHALHRLEDPASVSALMQALADPEWWVQSTVRHALYALQSNGRYEW